MPRRSTLAWLAAAAAGLATAGSGGAAAGLATGGKAADGPHVRSGGAFLRGDPGFRAWAAAGAPGEAAAGGAAVRVDRVTREGLER
jgi:hypothetical protein